MVHARRRVSYVIPPPTDSVPPLRLPSHDAPRLGLIGPLLLPSQPVVQFEHQPPKWASHPRHRLGVACLAIDTSTHLVGRTAPEGILYTGGRDGLVMSWDLEIHMKKRQHHYGTPKRSDDEGFRRPVGRWEIMTGWADEAIDEDAEESEEKPVDGDVLGDVSSSTGRRTKWTNQTAASIPYEHEWETDLDAFKPGKRSQFRQCVQTHTDWVNDILLCNYNQTVVSASSDGTIKAWNPHSTTPQDPSLIGSHKDYVRCLTHCREQNWLASGSFDRTIKLWDLSRTTQQDKNDPVTTLNPPDAPKSSVYAIAADPFGRAIASGSPERVVRMWDPRSGKRTGKLVGHTDNIRAILISDDSRYLLTGSADASVKLWSLASQRCLHTFMHHTDSVWSLFSSHPSLEVFYSGDKSGLVCKVDVEDCSDVSEGECIVLCHDAGERRAASTEGINKIVAMDDNLLWTASGSSSIKRWRVPSRRAVRAAALIADGAADHLAVPKSPVKRRTSYNAETSPPRPTREASPGRLPPNQSPRNSMVPSLRGSLMSDNGLPHRSQIEDDTVLYGIPFESLVRLASPNDPFTPLMLTPKGRDPDVATLYSAASVMSVPRAAVRQPLAATFHPSSPRVEDAVHPPSTARADFEARELAADAKPLYGTPDDVIEGDSGLVRSIILNDRIHALTVDTSGGVAVWDIVRGVCRGTFTREDVASASLGGSATERSNCEKERSPREALETVRERIEGEAVVVPWSAADTKTGVLTVHLHEKCFEAEIYADEAGFARDRHFNDESRLNIGKWVLRNLFLGFIREEQRARRKRDNDGATPPRRGSGTNHHDVSGNTSPKSSASDTRPSMLPSSSSSMVISSPTMIPALPPAISSLTRSPRVTNVMTLHPIVKEMPLPAIPPSSTTGPNGSNGNPVPRPLRVQVSENATPSNPPPSAMPKDADYFTRPPSSISSQGPDDFSGWAGPANTAKPEHGAATPVTPGGGLIGRLKNFGKISTKKSTSEAAPGSPAPGSSVVPETPVVVEELPSAAVDAKQTPLQVLLSGPLAPPPSTEAPTHALPPNMPLIISEEASHGWTTIYRGAVSSTYHDVRALEESMPMWLLEYLLTNRVAPIPVNKLSFVLLPWLSKDPDAEQLPELLNTAQSKLTASRFLRVRKLVVHVQDKLEKLSAGGSARSSLESPPSSRGSRPKGEDLFEILCNEIVLPLDMSLAVVRQYVWRQGGELTMHYRRKVAVASPGRFAT